MNRIYVLCVAGIFLWSCGGGAAGGGKTWVIAPKPDTQNPETAGVTHLLQIEPLSLSAEFFVPQGLYSNLMPAPKGSSRGTVSALRKKYGAATGEEKVKRGAILAGKLYGTRGGQEPARDVLREITKDGAAPEYVVEMLAIAEEVQDDIPAAAKAYEQLLSRFPDSEDKDLYRMRLAFVSLVAGNNERAAQLVEGWNPADGTRSAGQAYVVAWVRFRQGDLAGAQAAIVTAGKKWKDKRAQPAIIRDVMLFAGRAGADPAATLELLAKLAAGDKVKLSTQLADAYLYGGQYIRRSETYDILKREKGTASVRAEILFQQSDVAYKQNLPAKAAALILEANDHAKKIPNMSMDMRLSMKKRVAVYAQVYHSIYVTSYDRGYYDVAKKLYEEYLMLPDPPNKLDVSGNFDRLTKSQAAAGDTPKGLHDKAEVHRRMLAQQEAIGGCYERALQTDSALKGDIKLIFDIDGTGKVVATDSVPRPSGSGLGLTAACLGKLVGGWTFHAPAGLAGKSRVVAPIAFSRSK